MSKLLEISDLYGGYKTGVDVLQGIGLSLEQGEAVGIIGLNGSGKSTLGKAIMNMIPHRTGRIFLEGRDVGSKDTHELARMGIALMQQGGVVFPNLSVEQNLRLAWGSNPDKAFKARLEQIIPFIRQEKQAQTNRMADKLSGGQRHKLALAMALTRQPKLLVLDEPSAGLAPKDVEEMYGILLKIREEMAMTILLIEQNVFQAVSFCDRCELMEVGTITRHFNGHDNSVDEIERIMLNLK